MPVILGIESSCDETAAAVIKDGKLLANVVAGQDVHQRWGGVIPELASRAHQQNIVPVIAKTLKDAGILPAEIDGIAFTRGPGLLGSLLVGASFAKGFALALNKPLIEVNHMQAHILAHFIDDGTKLQQPKFPFLCLTVSGGHTQLVRVDDERTFTVLGETIDDAAGETFDKTAKILGLPYPGGPMVDKLAKDGNPLAYKFPIAQIPGLDFSFSGLKTAVLYFVRMKRRRMSLSWRRTWPMSALFGAAYNYKNFVKSAGAGCKSEQFDRNRARRGSFGQQRLACSFAGIGQKNGWNVFIPAFEYCTDNAAMIAMAGYFKFLKQDFVGQETAPLPRYTL